MLVIALSSIGLACENTVNENASINAVLEKFDYVFTTIFTIEMLLKVQYLT